MLRVSRTDSRGHFVIKGVKEGAYRVFALQDADGNYMFTQKSEKIAFNHDTVVPTCKPDIKQDTIWTDSLHISNISQTGYTPMPIISSRVCTTAPSNSLSVAG